MAESGLDSTKKGETFQIAAGDEGNYRILQDQIKESDAFGGKIKITMTSGRWNWYVEGSAQGLVADGGVNQSLTFTGWRLKNSGLGNQYSLAFRFSSYSGRFSNCPQFHVAETY